MIESGWLSIGMVFVLEMACCSCRMCRNEEDVRRLSRDRLIRKSDVVFGDAIGLVLVMRMKVVARRRRRKLLMKFRGL